MAYQTMLERAAGYIVSASADWNKMVNNFIAIWVGTTAGDMEYYASATTKTRVAAGSIGDVWIQKTASVPGWGSVYPVGAIYISTVSTNPATLLGFGTWAAFAAGRVLVGIDATQTEFDTAEEEGGEKTHALTGAENGPHTHSYSNYSSQQAVDSGGQLAAYWNPNAGTTGSSGSGTGHNNLQPYVVVYMFKRTA